MRIVSLTLLLFCLSREVSSAQQLSVQRYLQNSLQNNNLTAIQIAYTGHGRTQLYSAGNVSSDSKRGISDNTVFRAGSLGKSLFAYLTMRLCDRGLLSLDTPLLNYLGTYDRFLKDDPRYAEITARMVLSHTSGLSEFTEFDPHQPAKLLFAPGTSFSYSGEGYWLLQKVVEKKTGKPLEQLMKEEVFGPQGMQQSTFIHPATMDTEMLGPDSKDLAFMEPNVAFSLLTTAHDYNIFLQELLAGKGLKPASLNEMFRKQTDAQWFGRDTTEADKYIDWGLGFGLQENEQGKSIWHWGSLDDFYAFYVAYPKSDESLVIFIKGAQGLKAIDAIVNYFMGHQTLKAMQWLNLGYEKPESMSALFHLLNPKDGRNAASVFTALKKHRVVFSEKDLNKYLSGILKQKNYKKALSVAKQAEILFPKSPQLAEDYAAAWDGAGDTQQALLYYKKAYTMNKESDNAANHIRALENKSGFTAEQLKTFAGKYNKEVQKDQWLTITAAGNRLLLKQSWDGGILEFFRTGELEFYNTEPGFTLTFEKDVGGKISKAFVNTRLAWVRE